MTTYRRCGIRHASTALVYDGLEISQHFHEIPRGVADFLPLALDEANIPRGESILDRPEGLTVAP